MVDITWIIIGLVIGAVIGILAGYFYRKKIGEAKIKSAEDEEKRISLQGFWEIIH